MKKGKMTFNLALFAIWVLIFVIIAVRSPSFLSFNYIVNVMLRNIVEIGMVALSMTLIIITGGIDLSVGSTLVLSAMLGGMAATALGSGAGIVVTLLVGGACGLLNGLLVTKAKISPMVTTLATMFLYLGLARGISQGNSIYAYPFTSMIGNTSLFGIPIQIWLYAIMAVLFTIFLSRSATGRRLYSIGLNSNATWYSGIDVDKHLIAIYVLCGLVCALASFIWLGRFTSIKYDAGTNFNLKVITVVVLGGTSINGGVGDMKGTILGTLIIATLNSGLTVMNIPIDVQTVVQGGVLIAALISYAILGERAKRKRIIKVDSNANIASQV